MLDSPPVLPGTGPSLHKWAAKFQKAWMQLPHVGQESPVQSIKWKTHFLIPIQCGTLKTL